MKKNLMTTILISLILINFCSAEDKITVSSHQKLLEIKQKIENILREIQPGVTITIEENKLIAQYHTNKFMIHNIHKTGYISPKSHEEVGPNHDGFLLELSIHDGKHMGASVFPQNIRCPYWTTFINNYSIEGTNEYIWCNLSYGVRIDKKLLEEIKKCLGVSVVPNIPAIKNMIKE